MSMSVEKLAAMEVGPRLERWVPDGEAPLAELAGNCGANSIRSIALRRGANPLEYDREVDRVEREIREAWAREALTPDRA